MTTSHQLQAVNGQQTIPVTDGDIRIYAVVLSFAVAPSAGTVTVETQAIGSAAWVPVTRGEDVDITSGQAGFTFDGAIRFIRATFFGLVGGARPTLWVSSQDVATPPLGLLTDGGNGPNARLRVDVAQTGFFAGREFRTFKEWATPTTATYVIKAVVPINIILFELGVNIEAGTIRIETLVGGVEGGTFAEVLPLFPSNTMSEKPQPPYVGQVALTAGGTHTGGLVLDVLRAKTSGNSNFSQSVGSGAGSERGVAAGTYYFRVGLADVVGTFKARYEERP